MSTVFQQKEITSIYTMKTEKVKRNIEKVLAVFQSLGYTREHMQYKIPIQIENEDVIVAGLSLRQLMIMMIWGGIGYGIFKYVEPRLGATVGLWLGAPFVLIGVVVALMKISEMTFLPAALNFFRLSLNAQSRVWSGGTDSYSELEIGYVGAGEIQDNNNVGNQSYQSVENDEFSEKINKL